MCMWDTFFYIHVEGVSIFWWPFCVLSEPVTYCSNFSLVDLWLETERNCRQKWKRIVKTRVLLTTIKICETVSILYFLVQPSHIAFYLFILKYLSLKILVLVRMNLLILLIGTGGNKNKYYNDSLSTEGNISLLFELFSSLSQWTGMVSE
jgi:phage-related holin